MPDPIHDAEVARPTCASCPYWYDFGFRLGPKKGSCRRRSPKLDGECQVNWAVTHFDQFCGDHPAFPAYLASLPTMRAETGR